MSTNEAGEYVLRPQGRICLGEGLPSFQKEVADAVEQPAPRIVLDLAGVNYIDSSGLGEILKLFLDSKAKSKTLVLAHVPTPVQKLLRSTRLDKVFTIVDGS
jgi:anti-sigma B factor antagonist